MTINFDRLSKSAVAQTVKVFKHVFGHEFDPLVLARFLENERKWIRAESELLMKRVSIGPGRAVQDVQEECSQFIMKNLEHMHEIELNERHIADNDPDFAAKQYSQFRLYFEFYSDVHSQLVTSHNKEKRPHADQTGPFTNTQVTIAYKIMGIPITPDNYQEICSKHTTSKGKKILQQVIKGDVSRLANLKSNETANTRHLQTLQRARQLIEEFPASKIPYGKKRALETLDSIIDKFERNRDS